MPTSLFSAAVLTCAVMLAATSACSGDAAEAGTGGSPAGSGGSSAGSGGSPAASGGATSGSGGGGPSGGGAGEGGLGGMGGTPALPPCGCATDSQVVIEFPAGPRVYEVAPQEDSGCHRLTCQPETPYAGLEGLRTPLYYVIQACHEDGDCVSIFTGSAPPVSEQEDGRFLFFPADDGFTEEPVIIEATLVEDGERDILEFSFEANSAQTDATIYGSGRVCLADTLFVCTI